MLCALLISDFYNELENCLLLLFQNFSEYGMTLPVTDFGLQSLMQTAMLPQRPGETACAVRSPRNLYISLHCH